LRTIKGLDGITGGAFLLAEALPHHHLTTISPPSCLHLAANIEQFSGDQPICRTILVQGPAHLLYTAAQQAETAGQDT
jgi:hypothetical protein